MKEVRPTSEPSSTHPKSKLVSPCCTNVLHRRIVSALHLIMAIILIVTAASHFPLSANASSSPKLQKQVISELHSSAVINSSAQRHSHAQALRLYRKHKIRGAGDIPMVQSIIAGDDVPMSTGDPVSTKLYGQKRELIAGADASGGCSDRDIGILQSRDSSGGVPQFIVQIYNTCNNNCEPSDVHVNCEWFASKVVVNPGVFRRVAFNDCLVNAGKPIPRGQILRFTYQNSFMYRLSFKSAKFC